MDKEQSDYPKSQAFEEVWAILDRTAKRQEEAANRMDDFFKGMQEIRRMMNESSERHKAINLIIDKNAEQQKETDRKIAQLGDRWGEMVEYLVVPELADKFNALGFIFSKTYIESSIKDEHNKTIAEVDITLENGDKVILVEVKTKPSSKDITDHVGRIKKVKRYAGLRGDKRKYLGAIAAMVWKENTRDFALKQGFYVIEPSGETFVIIPPEGEPRVW